MAFAKPNANLSTLLNQWKSFLQQWALDGSLSTAADFYGSPKRGWRQIRDLLLKPDKIKSRPN